MKKANLKKLNLNKDRVAKLESKDLNLIKGGVDTYAAASCPPWICTSEEFNTGQ
ncbi:class I lanthipeptide [Flavobacteriaceae bacterium M23B6Z8]